MSQKYQHPSRRERMAARRRQQRFATIGAIAAGLVILVVLAVTFTSSQANSLHPARTGSLIDDFSLRSLDGQEVSLSQYRGQVVLINGWATWCPPCRAEMPDLVKFYQANKDKGFIILAVNAGETAEQAKPFVNQMGMQFPVLIDPNTRVLTGLGVTAFPTSIVVGRDGVVKRIHTGMLTPDSLQSEIAPFISQ